jgi:hypothetical protein
MECALEAATGRSVPCPEEACPFWEPGGAALPGACVLERVRVEVTGRPDLARLLLEVRERLALED